MMLPYRRQRDVTTQVNLLKAICVAERGGPVHEKSPFDGSKSLSDNMLASIFSAASNETPKSEAIGRRGDVADPRDGNRLGGLILRSRKKLGVSRCRTRS